MESYRGKSGQTGEGRFACPFLGDVFYFDAFRRANNMQRSILAAGYESRFLPRSI